MKPRNRECKAVSGILCKCGFLGFELLCEAERLLVFQSPIVSLIAVGPVRNCEKSRSRFCAGFFQAAVEIIKQKLPKATLIDFHGCAVSTGLPPSDGSFFLLLFLSCENPHLLAESFRARIAYKRRSTAGAAWSMAGFLPRASPDSLAPCGRSDPIPPQHRELVQRISPVLHSVPSPLGHDVFQGHVE